MQIRKYRASSSAPAIGTLKRPRIVICASGVITSAASRARLVQRTPVRSTRSGDIRDSLLAHPRPAHEPSLFHRPDLLDISAPVGKILVDLRQHGGAEGIDVQTVLFLDEYHTLALQLLAILGGRLAIPVERLLSDLDHRVFHDLAVRN